MKKTLVSALTTALVVGAASTTFAAANPFADVPADHWAYDAVAQLVQDGVVNGYAADGTFKGDQNMSRYEMAQIVAKAMAKSEAADNNNKALIDKLAAEFSDELANLGVRVADLEAKTDNVKWQGLIRYDWTHQNFESNTAHSNAKDNYIKLRFEPSMTINENWTGHARIDYDVQKDETTGGNKGVAEVKHLWTEGQYGKFDAKLGRFGTFSDNSHGLVMDTDVTGAEFTYAPTEAWKLKATAGRVDATDLWTGKSGIKKAVINSAGTGFDAVDQNQSATYWAAEVDYANGKWDAGVGYRNFGATTTNQDTNKDSFHVIDLGAGYAFDKNVKLTADYAWGPGLSKGLEDEGLAKNAYNVQLSYKGANAADAGSWGAYVAYRSLAPFAAVGATYDLTGAANTAQGWEIGTDYTFAKNIIATAKYFNGKDNAARMGGTGNGYNAVFTRVDFLF